MSHRTLVASLAASALGVVMLVALLLRSGSAALEPGESATSSGVRASGEVLDDAPAPPRDESGAQRAAQPDARERRAGEAGLRARVLHRRTRAPLAGFDAELIAGRLVLGRDTSDSSGRLFLPLPPAGGATLALQGPLGWLVQERVRFVAFREDGQYAPLEFLAGPQDSELFRARLVDADTREPVFDYMLRIGTRDGRREELVSDADGRVESATEFPEGTLLVFGYDERGPELGSEQRKNHFYTELEHRPEDAHGAPREIELTLGPTYLLELAGPPAVLAEPLGAALRIAFDSRATPALSGEAWVRRGALPWVRFPPGRRALETFDARMFLTVASQDGRWYGEAPVERSIGVHTVALELRPRGRLLVRVVDAAGNGIPGATVQLHPAVGGAPHAPLVSQVSSGNGLAEFLLVAPGPHFLSADAPAYERRFQALEVRADERTEAELALPTALRDGEISGRVVATHRLATGRMSLRLQPLRPAGGRALQLDVELEERGGERSAPFAFRELRAGDYALSAWSFDGARIEPRRLELSASARGIELRALPRAEDDGAELVFVALDASDGARVPSFFVESLPESGPGERYGLDDANTSLWSDSALDARSRWLVSATGYRPTMVSFAQARAEGETYVLEARLARGWAGELTALGPGFAPLAGVRVLLDGVGAGDTDASGRVQLSAERAPTSLQLRYRSWIVEPANWREIEMLLTGESAIARVFLTPP